LLGCLAVASRRRGAVAEASAASDETR